MSPNAKACLYVLFNVSSASAIVFANKAVFAVHHFQFPYALTLVHTVVTVVGMAAFASLGIFEAKRLSVAQVSSRGRHRSAEQHVCNTFMLLQFNQGTLVRWNVSLQRPLPASPGS